MISPGDKFGTDVKDMKSQTQFGLDLDYKFDVLPFHIAVGYHASSSEKGISTLSLSELRLGARKYQDFDAFSIYYGGGLSSVSAKLERDKYLLTPAVSLADATASALADYKAEVVAALNADGGDQDARITAVNNAANDAALDSLVDEYEDITDSTIEAGTITALTAAQATASSITPAAAPAVYNKAVSETASTLGFYGEVGGLYNVTEAIYVGANLTYTSATVEFEKFSAKKEKMDVGGAQIGLVVGYAF
jgi:hypothetical protein